MALKCHMLCKVLEYHPEPWNLWLKVGQLKNAREDHALLSIGPEQLSCLSGKIYLPAIIVAVLKKEILFVSSSQEDFDT